MINHPQSESSFSGQELRQQMAATFNLAELRALCYDVGIPFEELGGESQGLTAVIVKLLETAERHNRREALIGACARERPGMNWPVGFQSDQPCPYRGLFAFQEEDKHLFFGREAFTEMLTEFVLARPLTAVIGPSGSGKSSVVFAGLVPTLRQQGEWLMLKFRPGESPFHALASALLPHLEPTLSKVDELAETKKLAARLQAGDLALADILPTILQRQPTNSHLLLIADQFEELFTLRPDEEIPYRFLDFLLAETSGKNGPETHSYKLHLVCTIRADFMGKALAYPPLVTALQNNDIKLGPMTLGELRCAIEEPAHKANVQFEEKLVDRILDDVGIDGRNLPLLEFALTELWQQQQLHRLTHTAYERIGQVRGALARHADKVYESLTTKEQAKLEYIFVQLVKPGNGSEDTRRIATQKELGENNWSLVQKLAGPNIRLLVTDRDGSGNDTAEVIHETLIQRWERIKEWMKTNREFRAWQERLRSDFELWNSNNQDNGYLLAGTPLVVAQVQLEKNYDLLSSTEITFIRNSISFQQEVDALEEIRKRREEIAYQVAQQQKKQANRRIIFMVIQTLLILLIVLVTLNLVNTSSRLLSYTDEFRAFSIETIGEAKIDAQSMNSNLLAYLLSNDEYYLGKYETAVSNLDADLFNLSVIVPNMAESDQQKFDEIINLFLNTSSPETIFQIHSDRQSREPAFALYTAEGEELFENIYEDTGLLKVDMANRGFTIQNRLLFRQVLEMDRSFQAMQSDILIHLISNDEQSAQALINRLRTHQQIWDAISLEKSLGTFTSDQANILNRIEQNRDGILDLNLEISQILESPQNRSDLYLFETQYLPQQEQLVNLLNELQPITNQQDLVQVNERVLQGQNLIYIAGVIGSLLSIIFIIWEIMSARRRKHLDIPANI